MLKSLFNKVAGFQALETFRPATLLNRDFNKVISCKICKIFKNCFFYRRPLMAAAGELFRISVLILM